MFSNWPENGEFTFTVRIYARYSEVYKGIRIEATTSDFSALDDFVLLWEEEHRIPISEFSLAHGDIVGEVGKALDTKLRNLRAEHYEEEKELEETINSLKAITYNPEGEQ
jgi:hypothetical protein